MPHKLVLVLDAVMARRGPPCGAVHTVNSLRPTVRTGAAIPTIHCPHQQQHHDRSDSVSCSSSIMNMIWDLTLFATESLASLQQRPDWYRARAVVPYASLFWSYVVATIKRNTLLFWPREAKESHSAGATTLFCFAFRATVSAVASIRTPHF